MRMEDNKSQDSVSVGIDSLPTWSTLDRGTKSWPIYINMYQGAYTFYDP